MSVATLREVTAEAPAAVVRPRFKAPFSRKTGLAVTAALILAAGGAAYIVLPKPTVSTDAAYLQADSAAVAPRVRGLVAEVLVRHNQAVRRGDPLVRIDPEEFDARVASASADLANAQAAVMAAQAAFVTQDAEEKLAAANIRAARTTIQSADAQSERAQADRVRYEALVASGAVARRDADQYRATAISAVSDADHARAQLGVTQSQADAVAARRATLAANLAQAQAAVGRAQAALDLARQDQGHAVIRASIDGVVGDRQVEPGDYVQPGTRLLTLVPIRSLYVTANFKETQVDRMLVGQPATIEVDALPGRRLKGRVESFAPGSGSQFSLLPFEPGTGNFTKIVQRVPVRIGLDAGQPGLERLRPGLSTTVTVRLSS
ncbi:MAG TPA: HlyD family secretion protein [Caulobacteraceae bacterium]|nr:HlyD family secretion protein [Caulobacteraceae bacterium]